MVIDILSRYAWVRPLKNKSGEEITLGLKDIFSKGRIPKVIRSDSGKEFTNEKVQKFLQSKDIHHFTTNNEVKANYVERYIRSLKNRMYKYMNSKQTYQYYDVLQKLVNNYNNSYHRSIKTTPSSVNKTNEGDIWNLLYASPLLKREKFAFKPGDLVRISLKKDIYDRGFTQNWSDEIFEVVKAIPRNPPVYKIKDLNGEDVKGVFYRQELQRVIKDKDTTYQIEKILRKRKKDGKTQFFVKWLGYPTQFNSWVNTVDIAKVK